eukprot:m.227650 g.227650  ORF g.227650 m.227650 type:complete len:58 (+) comp17273_c0_seq1:812-985(+)
MSLLASYLPSLSQCLSDLFYLLLATRASPGGGVRIHYQLSFLLVVCVLCLIQLTNVN